MAPYNHSGKSLQEQLTSLQVHRSKKTQFHSGIGPPRNAITNREYTSQANSEKLTSETHLNKYPKNLWVTLSQINRNGWQVRHGEKPTTVHRWNNAIPGKEQYIPLHLFNIAQTELTSESPVPVQTRLVSSPEIVSEELNDSWLESFTEDLILLADVKVVYSHNPTICISVDNSARCLPSNFRPRNRLECIKVMGEVFKILGSSALSYQKDNHLILDKYGIELIGLLGTEFLLENFSDKYQHTDPERAQRVWVLISQISPMSYLQIAKTSSSLSTMLSSKISNYLTQ